MKGLPEPTPEERAHEARLVDHIRREIVQAGGAIDFARYMQLALYAPGLGYYAAGKTKFGRAGDFVTAPELGPLFARCVARTFAQAIEASGPSADVVELGAGSGSFAADALVELDRLGTLPSRYRILETSADLRERQKSRIESRLREALGEAGESIASRVEWLDEPPRVPWRGVLFANEVIDALPVQRFVYRDGDLRIEQVGARAVESRVGSGSRLDAELRGESRSRAHAQLRDSESQGGPDRLDGAPCFVLSDREATPTERAAIERLATPTNRYRSEYIPGLPAWFESITRTLDSGLALFVDYGYPRRAYYDDERTDGTLVCHYRHRAHDDPLVLVGLQDITAFVDFTAVAEAGVAAGLDFGAYLSQAQFLLASGLPEIVAESQALDAAQRYGIAGEAKRLTLPGEMGEKFQVIAFTRDFDVTRLPFAMLDRSDRL